LPVLKKTKVDIVSTVDLITVVLINECLIINIIYYDVKVAIIIQVGISCSIRKRKRLVAPGIGIVIKL